MPPSLPPLLADKRMRIILGCGCLLLGILNGILYYRDLALAAQSRADIHALNNKVTPPSSTPIATPTALPTIMSSVPPSPSPTVKPTIVPSPRPSISTPVTQATTGKVKITTATEAEFDSLPGIGPSKAKAIIEYRSTNPFTKLEDLKAVPGIGDKTYENLLPLIEL